MFFAGSNQLLQQIPSMSTLTQLPGNVMNTVTETTTRKYGCFSDCSQTCSELGSYTESIPCKAKCAISAVQC